MFEMAAVVGKAEKQSFLCFKRKLKSLQLMQLKFKEM